MAWPDAESPDRQGTSKMAKVEAHEATKIADLASRDAAERGLR
jgi:hypothetical protein